MGLNFDFESQQNVILLQIQARVPGFKSHFHYLSFLLQFAHMYVTGIKIAPTY